MNVYRQDSSIWFLYCYIASCTHMSFSFVMRYLIISQINCQALFLGLLLDACSFDQARPIVRLEANIISTWSQIQIGFLASISIYRLDQGSVVVPCRRGVRFATLQSHAESIATWTIVGQFPQLQHWSQIQRFAVVKYWPSGSGISSSCGRLRLIISEPTTTRSCPDFIVYSR